MARSRSLALIVSIFVASLVLSVSGASATSFGRCVKLESETGKYGTAGCQEGRVAKGKYEWYPALAEKGVAKRHLKLEVTGNIVVYAGSTPEESLACGIGAVGTGEISGNKELNEVVLRLTGCKARPGGEECSNTLEAGKIESVALEGLVGVWKKEPEERHNKIGLELFAPSNGTVFGIECGTTKRTIQGAIIPMMPPPTPNRMSETFELKFMRKGLEQMPEQLEGGSTAYWEQKIGAGSFAQVGVEGVIAIRSEEEIELNATCTC